MEGSPRESQASLKKHDHVVQWLNLGPKSLRRRTKKDISGAKAKRVPSVDLETLAAEIKKKPESKKLKKKLNDIFAENDALAKALKDKNTEIADLRRSVQSLNDVLNSVPIDELRCNSSIASTKILELSKKNRSLRAELETAKSRLSKKDVVLQKAERDLGMLGEKYKKLKESVDRKATPGAAGSNGASGESLLAKTAQLQQKVFESRNKITELQTQLKLAHKCLQQEVGSEVNVNTLMNGPSSWRGRAQQILHLQQKVHELKERLDAAERGPPLMPPPPPHGNANVATTFPRLGGGGVFRGAYADPGETSSMGTGATTSPSEQLASNAGVRRTELQHRAKVDKLEKELAELRDQLADSRQKILGLKVRNKTINDELLKYKMKTSTLEEQTDYHGINLDRLNDELNAQKQCYEQRLQQLTRQFESVMQQREQLEIQLEDVNNQLENLRQVVGDRDATIEQQEQTIEALQADMKALCGDFLFACRDFRRDEFLAILEALEYEKCGLVEHIQSLESRLAEERGRSDSLAEALQKYKLRFCRLEAKTRDMAKELETQAERKKRSQRVAEYANSLTTSPSVQSFVFENSAAAASGSGSGLGGKKDIENCLEFVELKHQLEFANEKISMLGERLCNLLEEKNEDANKFEAIIRNTKTVILETISGRRQVEPYVEGDGGGGDEADPGIGLYTPLSVIHEVPEETSLGKTVSRTNTSIGGGKRNRSATNNNANANNHHATSNNNYGTNNNNNGNANNNYGTNHNNSNGNANNNYATNNNNNGNANNNYATNNNNNGNANNNYATNNNNNGNANNNYATNHNNNSTNNNNSNANNPTNANNNVSTTKNNTTSNNNNNYGTKYNTTSNNNSSYATNNTSYGNNNTSYATNNTSYGNNNTPHATNNTNRTLAASQ